MHGVRLSSLTISHFRGINQETSFNFSAPLTLVYAPNGTGKTTMCEATEWLLTGQVERLKDGKGFDPAVLRSKFASGSEKPMVFADIVLQGQQRFVRRVADLSQSTAFFGSDEASATVCRPFDILAQLAPAAAADEAHPLTAINLRQRWLKGTRFLSAEALAALVDTDDGTIERRTQIFADLLGIRHLLDAKRQCDKFTSEISSRLRALNTLVEQQLAESQALKQSLQGDASDVPASSTSARSEARAAVVLLDPQPPVPFDEAPEFDDVLAALNAALGRRRHAMEARKAAVHRAEAQEVMYPSLELAVSEATVLEAQLARSLSETEERERLAAATVAELTSQRDAANESARELVKAKDELSHLSIVLLAALRDAGALDGSPNTISTLLLSYPEGAWSRSAREKRRIDLLELERALEGVASQEQRMRMLESEIAAARENDMPEAALATLRAEIAQADAIARSAATQLDSTAEPVARLLAAARELLTQEHGVDVSTCPTCAHDWGDNLRLRAAMEATLSEAPALVNAARASAAKASDVARSARQRLDVVLAAKAHIAMLETQRAALFSAADVHREACERLGLDRSATSKAIRHAHVHLSVSEALGNLVDAAQRLGSPTVASIGELLDPEGQVSGLLDHLDAAFSENDRAIQLRLASLTTSLDQAKKDRNKVLSDHASTRQNLLSCRAVLEQRASDLADLHSAWEAVAPGMKRSPLALSELKAQLETEGQILLRAEGHLEAARSSWSAETRRIRLEELQRELEPSLERQSRLNQKLDAAKRAAAVFHEAYSVMSHKRVDDLSRIVNPLFARMHANRVFDRINLGSADKDFLHWLADAGGQELDPGKDFSQGQRQDLALAIFLARARSLGGTFFLDEPITHLDDLNRVGLLDILRATVLESSRFLNLVITTSSRALARHLIEKFSAVGMVETSQGTTRPLRVLELDGNARSGVRLSEVYP